MDIRNPIWIMGQRYTVDKFDACVRDNDLGNCDVNKCQIGYWSGLPHEAARDVVLHEIMHAVYFLMALSDDSNEEDVVTRLSTGLTCTLLDPRNEGLIQWYFSSPDYSEDSSLGS